jgi:hypothetical protein
LLNYFKPKLQSAQVKSDSTIKIEVIDRDWNDGDGH